MRPSEISGDNEPTVSALAHVVENIAPADNVILMQLKNPPRPENLPKEAYETYIIGNHDSLFIVSRNHQKFRNCFRQ